MPRIRTIKPEFFDSPGTAAASYEGRLFFIALWCWADDYGIGTASPKQLIAFAFPEDPLTVTDFPRLRTEVATCFGVVWYEADGRPYFAIPSWDRHQKNERRANRRNPPPSEGDPVPDKGKHDRHGDSASLHGSSVQTVGSSGPGTGEQGNRGTEDQSSSSEIADAIPDKNDREDITRICNHLADRVAENGSKRPSITKTWRDAARLMIDTDGRTEDQVHACIDWCQRDEFWRTNILSIPKLRDKYDQLRLRAQQRPAANGRPATGDLLAAAMERAEAADLAAEREAS